MRIIFYKSKMNKMCNEFQHKIQKELSEIEFITPKSIKTLSKILCQPMNGISVAVLLTSSSDELSELIELLPFFEDIRVILVLPDRKKKTLTLGLELYPSFISYNDGVNDICAVIKKIQKNSKEN